MQEPQFSIRAALKELFIYAFGSQRVQKPHEEYQRRTLLPTPRNTLWDRNQDEVWSSFELLEAYYESTLVKILPLANAVYSDGNEEVHLSFSKNHKKNRNVLTLDFMVQEGGYLSDDSIRLRATIGKDRRNKRSDERPAVRTRTKRQIVVLGGIDVESPLLAENKIPHYRRNEAWSRALPFEHFREFIDENYSEKPYTIKQISYNLRTLPDRLGIGEV